jgi:hypothetical protein
MIEIFKTNVETEREARLLKSFLSELFPTAKITFDLEDCDRILRIEMGDEPAELLKAAEILAKNGFFCEVLPDEIPPKKITTRELQLRYTFTFKNTMRTAQ